MRGVIGVRGISYCGSTLAALMLDGHSRVKALGEMSALGRTNFGFCKICREARSICPVWPVEFTANLSAGPDLHPTLLDHFETEWLIDISKNHLWHELLHNRETNYAWIVLSKSPCAHVYSFLKRGKDFDHSVESWVRGYSQHRKFAESSTDPLVILRYEDLVTDPAASLKKILEPCGLEYEDGMDRFYERTAHLIRCNPGALYSSDLALDRAWEGGLTDSQITKIWDTPGVKETAEWLGHERGA